MPAKLFRYASRTILILLLAWIGLALLAALFYPRLLYHPDHNRLTERPDHYNLRYENLWLTTPDKTRINAWHIPAGDKPRAAAPTLLVFHGNAGNLSLMLPRLRLYHSLGLDVYAVDYPGFGESDGTPSEESLYAGAAAIWEFLVKERNIPPDAIVIHGYSLGGAVAAWLAGKQPQAAGLILESTFTRLSDVAARLFPWLPCRLILGEQYNTLRRLDSFAMPLLVIHGEGDELVPYDLGRTLFETYKGRKDFVRIGNDHNIGFLTHEREYVDGLRRFLDSLEKPVNGKSSE